MKRTLHYYGNLLKTKRINHILLFIYLILFSVKSFPQKRGFNQYEVIVGGGPTNFLGELGGANAIGTHFLRDFNLNATRFCANAGVRYSLSPYLAVKSMFSFAMVSGSDNLTNERCRRNRNLSFRSPIAEISVQGEFYFIGVQRRGFNKSAGSFFQKKKLSAYLFAGIGVFYYSPQASYNGAWYNLRNLHTEGEGLPGGAKPYGNTSVCLPFGAGVKYKITNHLSIGIELGERKTFTDYIDDVSTTYYNRSMLYEKFGPVAATLSDPSLGEIPGATKTASQRGNSKYKDAYIFLSFNIGYKLVFRNNRPVKF